MPTQQTSNNYEYKSIAEKEFTGRPISYIHNEDKRFVLCISNENKTPSIPSNIHFIVYDRNDQKMIYRREIGLGTVEWYANKELKIIVSPGMIRQGETVDDYTFIYDLLRKEERRL